jgi:hypothetical protein
VLDGPANGRLSTGNCESIRDERRSVVRVSPSDIELGLIRIKENENLRQFIPTYLSSDFFSSFDSIF